MDAISKASAPVATLEIKCLVRVVSLAISRGRGNNQQTRLQHAARAFAFVTHSALIILRVHLNGTVLVLPYSVNWILQVGNKKKKLTSINWEHFPRSVGCLGKWHKKVTPHENTKFLQAVDKTIGTWHSIHGKY